MTSLVQNYNRKTQDLINALMRVKDNSVKTYRSDELQRRFDIVKFNNLEFDLTVGQDEEGEPIVAQEKYYAILACKRRPLDVK